MRFSDDLSIVDRGRYTNRIHPGDHLVLTSYGLFMIRINPSDVNRFTGVCRVDCGDLKPWEFSINGESVIVFVARDLLGNVNRPAYLASAIQSTLKIARQLYSKEFGVEPPKVLGPDLSKRRVVKL